MFTKQKIIVCILGMAASAASSQYPGQITKKSKDAPTLRAIAVLEWTGDEVKPKASRLIPVTVYDGGALQDANVYLARPHPMALARETEYELQKNGRPIGLYDIKNAGQEQGTWVGYGSWKPNPVAKVQPVAPVVADGNDEDSDRPTLHRKHPESAPGKDSDKTSGSDSSTPTSSTPSAPSDPDRPTLHKKTTGTDTTTSTTNPASDPAADPDRPTLHKPKSSEGGDTASAPDPDRPTLHGKTKADTEAKEDDSGSGFTDPDRPLLKRGKSTGNGIDVLPSLMGLPLEMQQAVAVSDAKNRPEHPWSYTWANPDDQAKMKAAMESIARDALGLKVPAVPAPKRTTAKSKTKPAVPPTPPPLTDEQFHFFELAYGSGATLVLSAHTDGPAAQQKFVTLIGQPDLYGNALVLLKNVTDGAHLDDKPRMCLVDAVDALADNRGELLFELRGATQRQFALYRILRGTAERIFVTGGGEYGVAPGE